MGLTPDSIVFRVPKNAKLSRNDIALVGLETGLSDKNDVYTNPDCDSVYELPKYIHDQDLDKRIINYFKLKTSSNEKTERLQRYTTSLKSLKKRSRGIKLGIFGKTVSDDSYLSLKEAIEHASVSQNLKTDIVWLDESENYKKDLSRIDALIIGEGLNHISSKMASLRYARENSIPCLAISFGCNLLIKEFCGKILEEKVGIEEVEKAGPASINKTNLRTGSINITLRSPLHYERGSFNERIRHCSMYSEKLIDIIMGSSLLITGIDNDSKQPVIFEDPKHPFYVGCMFHPEYISHPGHHHPLFAKLIKMGAKHKYAR